MEFRGTKIPGVTVIESITHNDDRGHFVRTYCDESFRAAGLEPTTAQMSLSHNKKKGTLRGLHFIPEENGEAKLVRCVKGAVFDVAVDLRPKSDTFCVWFGIELNAKGTKALYLPRGVAHGFISLMDDTDILYQFSEAHRPGIELGIAWDDPDVGVDWPIQPVVISKRDQELPLFSTVAATL